MTPGELCRRGLPWQWSLSYLAFATVPLALLMLSLNLPSLGFLSEVEFVTQAALVHAGSTLLAAFAIGLALSVGLSAVYRRELRKALADFEAKEDVVLVALAFHQVKGRYRIRPSGALVITPTQLAFVPSKAKHAKHAVSLNLADVESVELTRDRYGFVSRLLDVQGSVELTCAGTSSVFSVLGCQRFLDRFKGVWGACLAATPRDTRSAPASTAEES